jgi:hypothetical protein
MLRSYNSQIDSADRPPYSACKDLFSHTAVEVHQVDVAERFVSLEWFENPPETYAVSYPSDSANAVAAARCFP